MISCSTWGTSDTETDVERIEEQKNENHTLWMVVEGWILYQLMDKGLRQKQKIQWGF